jgi:hypothetical protein
MFSDARNVAGVHGQQRAHAGEAERESQRAAQHGEHGALGEQLANDASASGADGGADGDLALAARRAHQQETGDVGAGYQQHETDGAGQHQ